MLKPTLMLLMATFATALSNDVSTYAQEQQELNSNIVKFAAFAGSPGNGYAMEFQRSCFCMPDTRSPFFVVVNSTEEVASAVFLDGGETPGQVVTDPEELDDLYLITVQDAFDEIQQAIDEGVYFLNVTYDAVGGYPTDVDIDWDDRIADEETYYTISNVVPL